MIDSDPLLCVIGMERSGTIWTTRLIAQAIDSPSQTRYREPPFGYDRDPVVWGEGRPGGLIRRLHAPAGPSAYRYQSPVVLVVRDPRSIAVSQIYFHEREREREGIFDAHFKYIIQEWAKYYSAWTKDDRVISVVRYEDMLANPQVELNTVVMDIFRAQVPIHRMPNSKEIAATVRDNSFDNMKNWAKGSGIRGNWRTHLSKRSRSRWQSPVAKSSIIRELGYG